MIIKELLGKTLIQIVNSANEELDFTLSTGEQYRFYHNQDCCKTVLIEDICGELFDLIGSPLTQAEVNSSNEMDINENLQKLNEVYGYDIYSQCSFTWTFYRFATKKGQVVIRWFGCSNGYYSERVSLAKFDPQTKLWKDIDCYA